MTRSRKFFGLGGTLPLNAINVAALALGFLQQLAVVKCHEASAITDFYFLLIVVPQIIINLSNSITNNALLPFMVRRREQQGDGDEAALIAYFESRILQIGRLMAVGALGIGIAQALSAPAWREARWDVALMLISAPFLILYGAINSLYTTTLQSRGDYWRALAALLFAPFFGLIFGWTLAPLGAWPFVAGQSIGMALQYAWLKKRVGSFSETPREKDPNLTKEEHEEVRSKVGTLFLIAIGFQFLPFIERTIAQKAGTGSVAAIALASRLGNSVSPLILSATAMTLFTTFAKLAATGNLKAAAIKLLRVLATLQWFLAALLLIGPFLLAQFLPMILPQPTLVKSILHVFPDYLLAGCIGSTGLLTTGCYYSVFKDFRFQLHVIYAALAIYALLLTAPWWSSAPFGLRIISQANVAYSVLVIVSVTLYVAVVAGRMFPWHYLVSLMSLVGAWLFVRSRF